MRETGRLWDWSRVVDVDIGSRCVSAGDVAHVFSAAQFALQWCRPFADRGGLVVMNPSSADTSPGRTLSPTTRYRVGMLSRILAASIGGYVLMNIVTVAFTFLLPVENYTAFLFSVQTSFLVYSITIIWVFTARTATKAWLGLLVLAVPLALIDWYFYKQGAAV